MSPGEDQVDPAFPHLRRMAELYFHEDYDVVYGTAQQVVSAVRENGTATAEIVAEIDAILASTMTEEVLREFWLKDCYSSYEPDRKDGITYRQWLALMRQILSIGSG